MGDPIISRVYEEIRAGDELADRILGLLETLPVEKLRTLAGLYVDEVRFLGEHLPAARETGTRYPCTRDGYHSCSVRTIHHVDCPAAAAATETTTEKGRAELCQPDCDARATEESWCRSNGFDCPDCAMVDALVELLGAEVVH